MLTVILLCLGSAALVAACVLLLWFWRRHRYTVYHRTTFDLALMLHGEVPPKVWSRDYVKVAEVGADDLEEVFRRTNTIEFYWWEDPKVVRSEPIVCRSTSVGDVISLGKRAWVVASSGFTPVAWAEGSYQPDATGVGTPAERGGTEPHGWWLPIADGDGAVEGDGYEEIEVEEGEEEGEAHPPEN